LRGTQCRSKLTHPTEIATPSARNDKEKKARNDKEKKARNDKEKRASNDN